MAQFFECLSIYYMYIICIYIVDTMYDVYCLCIYGCVCVYVYIYIYIYTCGVCIDIHVLFMLCVLL